MDNYLPADFHALRAQLAADWRDASRRCSVHSTELVEQKLSIARLPYSDRANRRDRSANDCIDPGWQSL